MNAQLEQEFAGRLRFNEPMSAHSSWHSGGPAQMYFTPRDATDLAEFLQALPRTTPLYWVGLGTNLLVREGGWRGVLVATPGAFTRIERRTSTQIYCEASVPCARIARLCAAWEMVSAEFFGGIPGTLGGALAMNAGAFGDETWRHVLSVETMDRDGQRHHREASEFRYGYRQVQRLEAANGGLAGGALDEIFLAALLSFESASAAEAARGAPVQSLLQRRRETQPLGAWSCGSVFKNPPGDHAARLIDTAGLKGYRVGHAVVSDKHANFIINEGGARPGELEQVILHVQATVQRVHGVRLEPEVRIIGEPGAGAAAAGGA